MGNSETKEVRIAVVGSGLAGSTAAYCLGRDKELHIDVFEKSNRTGGIITTRKQNGFLYELGGQSILTKYDEVQDLIDELAMDSEIVFKPKGFTPLIIRDGKPIGVKPTPTGFLSSKILTWQEKGRILLEPFQKKTSEPDLTISEFCSARFGKMMTEYLIDPMISSTFGGPARRLSAKHAFSKAWQAEQNRGSVLLGMGSVKKKTKYSSSVLRKIFTFKEGLETLPKALQAKANALFHMKKPLRKMCLRSDGKWDVGHWAPYDAIVSTIPPHELQKVGTCKNLNLREALHELSQMTYSALSMLFLGFENAQDKLPWKSYGCLAPTIENRDVLALNFTANTFEGRVPENGVGLNVFFGGGDQRKANITKAQAVAAARKELKELFDFDGEPVTSDFLPWTRAIPQFELGHEVYANRLTQVESDFPGLFLAGNYREGIGLSDAILSGILAAGRVEEYLKK